ncbi:hypothetical protein AM10699_62780 (plasmid) [Acaryochloris marina MBIC10699]|nr:hypothetical protein AM10699_62780 [Acaryochloris marina MBIC10699]
MYPLLMYSIVTVSCVIERLFFWRWLLIPQRSFADAFLTAATENLARASLVAQEYPSTPIHRVLTSPLKLKTPTPEMFRLAIESALDRELVNMSQGHRILEAIASTAPLLGLLGTVTGLIQTFSVLQIGENSTAPSNLQATSGIGEALITTASGMIIALLALLALRFFKGLQARQEDVLIDLGNRFELIYLQTLTLTSPPHETSPAPYL